MFLFLARSVFEIFDCIAGYVNYCKAGVYDGTVIGSLGTERTRDLFVGKRVTYTYYENYEVAYTFKGENLKAHVFASQRDLQPGDYIPVYIIDNYGVPEIQSDTYGARLKSFVIATLLFAAMIAAFVIYFIIKS